MGNIGLLPRSPISDKATIMKASAQDHSIHVDDEIIVVDDKPVTVMMYCDSSVNVTVGADVKEKVKHETAWLYLNTELGFGMKIKKHLGMMITRSDGLTDEVDRLIGISQMFNKTFS